MAVTTENANLVWQKAKAALADASPAIQGAFADLKMYLSTQGRNPDLQFIPYSEAQAIANNGTDLTGGAGTLYGFYVKAVRTTGTTSAFVSLHASADQTGEVLTSERLKATGQKVGMVWPTGKAFVTGLCVSSATTIGGTTESTTPDGPTGFVIVGA
jgi:hypothetical protein